MWAFGQSASLVRAYASAVQMHTVMMGEVGSRVFREGPGGEIQPRADWLNEIARHDVQPASAATALRSTD
jgi:hypothetical protein